MDLHVEPGVGTYFMADIRDKRPTRRRAVPGLAEMLRAESRFHTPLAWLSRACAVQLDGCLVLALPGSPRAVAQAFDILAPVLAHALAMVAGKDHS